MRTRTTRLRATLLVLLIPLLLLSLAAPAHAALSARGPVKATAPGQGFPTFYRDMAGVALELNVGPVNSRFSPIEPASPGSAARGFGEEAFYWSADSVINTPSGPVTLLLGLEATASQNVPAVGYRVRVTGNAPAAGAFTVTHPFGTIPIQANAAVNGLNFNDPDVNTAGFDLVLQRPIGNFLKSTTPPAGFLGDAVTPTPVTGGNNGVNVFRIEGPNIGGPGVNVVESSLFRVQGKIDFANTTPAGLVSLDTMAPMVTATVAKTTGSGTVTLTGTDAGVAGFSHLAYHVDKKAAVTVPGATATINITPGQHTVTFWGFDMAGNKSAVQTVTVQVKGKPNLSLPKISPASPRRLQRFTMSGKVGHPDVGRTRVAFVIQRRVGNRWVAYKTVRTTLVTGRTTFSAKTRLARRGLFRVRTTHAEDAVHIKGVSKWKTFRIR